MSAKRVVSLNISLSRCQSFSWAGVPVRGSGPLCHVSCSPQPAVEPAVCSLSLAAQAILSIISDSTQVPGKLVIKIINEMGVNRRETSMRGIRPGSAHFDPVTSQRL